MEQLRNLLPQPWQQIPQENSNNLITSMQKVTKLPLTPTEDILDIAEREVRRNLCSFSRFI